MSVVGTDVTTTTDADGKYTLQVPVAVRGDRLQLKVDGLGLPPKIVDVATDSATVTADVALTLAFSQEITVGSRVAGDESEKAVPVDIITHSQIAASGYTETAQVIASLAPSLNFPRPTITDGTDTVRPATLRGLGPDQVLVLINGKRRHQSSLVHLNNSIGRGSTGVDLNAIPLAAIDHIEVLRDGAAAQYGSDAIAGVINIVLAGGVARPSVTANVGVSDGLLRGQPLHAGRPFVHASEMTSAFPMATSPTLAGSWGIGVGKGSITVAAEYRHHNHTNRASFDPRDQIVSGDAGRNDVAQPNHRWGDPDTRDVMTFVNASIPLDASQTRLSLCIRRLQSALRE